MALGATFWGNLGLAALWHDITTLVDSGLIFSTFKGIKPLYVGCCKIYQEPMGDGGDGEILQKDPGYNSGYFYLKEITTGETTWCNGVWLFGGAEPTVADNGRWVKLEPYFKVGDIVPAILPSVANPQTPQGPLYKTGFLLPDDVSEPAFTTGGHFLSMDIATDANIPGDWLLYHYSPFAWSGTPPEVVASAAMHAGVPADYIDQDAFDDAHDAYDLSTGDSPWSDLDDKWTIYARRVVGTKVSEFLIDCINHGRDLLFVNEEGKLSTSSWTRPSNTTYGIDATDDQMISVISHTMTIKHLFNSVNAGWGSAASQSWGVPGSGSGGPLYTENAASDDPILGSKFVDKWIHQKEITSSVDRYGRIWLSGSNKIVNFKGQPQAIESSHYPYLLSPHVNRATLYEWDPDIDGGGMIHVTNWLTSDAKPRAEIEIRQGPMGFDLSIGDLVTNLEITGDGRTIAEARIIERTYNFDTLTIDSLIMEVPDNT